LPSLSRLQEAYDPKDFTVLIIHIGGPRSHVAEFVDFHGYSLRTLVDEDKRVTRTYGVLFTPTHVIIDKRGQVVGRSVGPKPWDSEAAHRLVKLLMAQ